jgi:hypothetical protein
MCCTNALWLCPTGTKFLWHINVNFENPNLNPECGSLKWMCASVKLFWTSIFCSWVLVLWIVMLTKCFLHDVTLQTLSLQYNPAILWPGGFRWGNVRTPFFFLAVLLHIYVLTNLGIIFQPFSASVFGNRCLCLCLFTWSWQHRQSGIIIFDVYTIQHSRLFYKWYGDCS